MWFSMGPYINYINLITDIIMLKYLKIKILKLQKIKLRNKIKNYKILLKCLLKNKMPEMF